MSLQYLTDANGNTIAVQLPIQEWERLQHEYTTLKQTLDKIINEHTRETVRVQLLEDLQEALAEIKNHEANGTTPKSAKALIEEIWPK